MGEELWKGSDGQSDLHGLIWAGGFTAKIPSSLGAPLSLSLFMGHLIFWGFSMPWCGFGIITLLTGGTQEAGCGSPGPMKKHIGDGTASLCCVLLVKAMMGPIQIQGDGAPDARSQHRAGRGKCWLHHLWKIHSASVGRVSELFEHILPTSTVAIITRVA